MVSRLNDSKNRELGQNDHRTKALENPQNDVWSQSAAEQHAFEDAVLCPRINSTQSSVRVGASIAFPVNMAEEVAINMLYIR